MLVTKREHAFLEIESDAGPDVAEAVRLLIDPGTLTTSVHASNVVAVVITHEHFDHVTREHLESILEANPAATIFADEAVAASVAPVPVDVVAPGDLRTVGPFTLEFVGGKHAIIHSSIPRIGNVGVIVNGALYHPGDSFDPPGKPVAALAVPTSGPWMKLGEAMDFLVDVGAEENFGIHDCANSDFGRGLATKQLTGIAEPHGQRFTSLEPGESIEVDA